MSDSLRALLVDDNPQDRRLVKREVFQAFPDATVLEVTDQRGFEAAIEEGQFDVVVTDYRLRWSDGIRVLKEVRKHLPQCPVIMFTGTGDEEVAVEAMKNGLDDYVVKDVQHLKRLRASIQKVVEFSETRRRAGELAVRLDAILGQLAMGTYSCSSDGSFLEMNDAMAQIIEREAGISPGSASLKSMFDDESRAESFLQEAIQSEDVLYADVIGRRAAARIYRVSGKCITGSGEPPRIEGLCQDITSMRRMEADAKDAAVAAAKLEMLSEGEKQILREAMAGHPNKVAARRLDVSERTVEKRRASIFKKLQISSIAELVRLGVLAERADLEPVDHY